MAHYLGIDPGLHGGWALLTSGGELVSMSALPLSGGALDPVALADQWRACPPINRVALELVHAMPGQGVTSMFSFGETAGVIRGVLGALGHVPVRPTPQRWQRALGVALTAEQAASGKAALAAAELQAEKDRRKALSTLKASRRAAVKARATIAAANILGLDASQLIPKGCRVVHDGLVDAVCIAEWLRRQEAVPWDA